MRHNRQVTLIALGVVFLFVIAACGGGSGDVPGGAPTTPFIGGNKGLEIGFLDDLPPKEVTDGGFLPFQAIVKLKNVGEFDLKRNQVSVNLIGIDPRDFGVNPTDLKNRIPEDDPSPRQRDAEGNIIEATETFVTFPASGSFNFNGDIVGNSVFIFRADVCYRYQTKALSEICVLENLIDTTDDTICDASGTKPISSSGSPIQVNRFRETVVGKDKIQFSFDIVHSGPGSIFGGDFITFADQPLVVTRLSQKLSDTSVKLNGEVNPQGELTTAWFEYGTSSSNLNIKTPEVSVGNGNSPANFERIISSGLTPNTVHYYRTAAKRVSDNLIVYGKTRNFIPNADPTVGEPEVLTRLANFVTTNSARFIGEVTSRGQAVTTWFEYGKSNSLGTKTVETTLSAGNTGIGFRFYDTGSVLEVDTVYFLQFFIRKSDGTVISGEIRSFRTSGGSGGSTVDTTITGGCPKDPQVRRSVENRVRVTVNTGLANLNCVGLEGNNNGIVNLIGGKRTVTCTQDLDPGRTDFKKNVDITLDFNYLDNADREVLVKHLIG